MKISPISSPAAVTASNAIPNTVPRNIRMSTNATPLTAQDIPQSEPDKAAPTNSADTTAVKEDTKPLGPQFAALANQRRELQLKEKQLAEREKAIQSKPASDDLIARLKSQPLSVLQEHGVTYDQLTEAILNSNSTNNPEVQQLKAEIKALKEGLDKTFVDRDTQAKQAALNEMRKEASILSKNDSFELVRETNSIPEVIDLIDRTYTDSGEILDVSDAMQLVENELISEAKKIANLKKVKGLILPETPSIQPQLRQPVMKTLTNRDTASPVLDRRARALAAALGQLRK